MIKANDFTPAGGSLHSSGGETSSPRQEYLTGMDPPFAKALLVNVNGLVIASVEARVEVEDIVEAGLSVGCGAGSSVTVVPHAKRNKQLTSAIMRCLIFMVCPSSGDEQDGHTYHGKHGPCDGLPAQTLLEKEITDRQHKDRREGCEYTGDADLRMLNSQQGG